MAREKDGALAEVEPVDVSPEAQEARRLVEKAGATLLDRGRVQAIVERWRRENPDLSDPVTGTSIPIPPIGVTLEFVQQFDRGLIPLIEDCCVRSRAAQLEKWRAQRRSQLHGGGGVETSLATALRGLRGRIIEQVEPG